MDLWQIGSYNSYIEKINNVIVYNLINLLDRRINLFY